MKTYGQTKCSECAIVILVFIAAMALQAQAAAAHCPGVPSPIVNSKAVTHTSTPGSDAEQVSQETPGAAITPTASIKSQKTAEKPAVDSSKKVLAVDVGGTNIKILCTGQTEPRRFPSGSTMTPARMVDTIKDLARDWVYDVVSIGYPGRVVDNKVISEPHNLAKGWIGFDFAAAFGRPTKLMNDAAMQALGSYKSGTMLFVGLGTGLGSALIADSVVIPLELGHLSYKDATIEDYVGKQGQMRLGKAKWRKHVDYVIARLIEAIHPDDVVIGGGEAAKLKTPPPGCRLGSNTNAFLGGYRLWEAK